MTLTHLAAKLARTQAAHPWWFLGAAVVLTGVAAGFASGLRLDTQYEALLPADSVQVQTANEVRERTGGTRQLVVAIGGADPEARLDFGRRLVPLFREMDEIRSVELELPVDFIRDRALWLVDDETLEGLVAAGERAARIFRERHDVQPLRLFAARVRDTLESGRTSLPSDGIMTSSDGQYTFLVLIPRVSLSDLAGSRALLEEIRSVVDGEHPDAEGLEVRCAGTMVIYVEQQQVIGSDLRNASIVAFVLCVLLVVGFTKRFATPALIAVVLACGIIWTYGAARLVTDRLTMVTGFLGSVLLGLGIDFGIHLFIRFQEELRRADGDKLTALVECVVGVLRPATTSALTTSATFVAFVIAEFPPFYEFGLIAGIGVMMTLICTFLVLPPLLYLVTGKRAIARALAARPPTASDQAWRRAIPRPVAIGVLILFAGVSAFGALHVRDVRFVNDFRALRGTSPATEFSEFVSSSMGVDFNPAVTLTPSIEGAARIAALARADAAASEGERPYIGRVLAVSDLLPPSDVEQRQRLIDRLRAAVDHDDVWQALADGDERVARVIEMAHRMLTVGPWTVEELPETFRRRFLTLDGQSYVTFIWPGEPVESDVLANSWEPRLRRIEHAARTEDIPVVLADEVLIRGWVSRMVLDDTPRVIPLAVAVVLLILLIDYRSLKHTAIVASSLAVGMLTYVAAIHVFDITLNMFNIVAVPSVVGIGIAASVHIYQRYRREGPGSVLVVLRHTGIAVFLAAATTAVGFGSSLVCHKVGLRTLGTLAVAGITATFVAAVFFFPVLLTVLEGRRSGPRRQSFK